MLGTLFSFQQALTKYGIEEFIRTLNSCSFPCGSKLSDAEVGSIIERAVCCGIVEHDGSIPTKVTETESWERWDIPSPFWRQLPWIYCGT